MLHSLTRLIILAAVIAPCATAAIAQSCPEGRVHVCAAHVPQEKALLDAIWAQDSALVGRLLRQGVSPNARDDCGITALHRAATGGSPEILKQLLAYQPELNPLTNSFDNQTPLMWALERSDVSEAEKTYEVVRLLVEAGADVNLKGKADAPPLTVAVQKGLEKVVELFIAAGAKVNALDGDDSGRTAYSYAAEMGNGKLKSMLLAAGADARLGVDEFKRQFGADALIHAASDGRTDVIEALLAEGLDPDTANAGEVTALMRVVNDSSFDALVSAGADVNRRDNAGFTALAWAAYFGRVEQVRKLIALGADANATIASGATILDMAKPEVKALLLEARARRGQDLLERLSLRRK